MDTNTIAVWVIIIVAVALIIYVTHQKSKEAAVRDARALAIAQEEFQAFADAAHENRLPALNDRVIGVILKPDEKCVALAFGVQQIVPVKQTRYVGGSHGVSVRITKGVSYRVGSFRGRPVTTVSEKVGDQGNLYVTSQRVVFAGLSHITSLPVNKVADARVDSDRVVLIAENKANPLVFRLTEKYRPALIAAATHLVVDQISIRAAKRPKLEEK